MNKAELIEVVASRIDASKKESAEYVQAVVDAITEAVAKGQKVSISGFGVFEKAARPARTYRKPSTGEEIPKQATWVPRFRPGGDFKALVSGEKNLVSLARTTAGDIMAAAGSAVDQAKAAVGMKPADTPASAQQPEATPAPDAPSAPAAEAPAKKAPAKRAPAKRAPAKRAPAKRAAPAEDEAPAQAADTEAAAEKAPAKRAPAKRAPAKRTAKKAAAPAPEAASGEPAAAEATEPAAQE